MIAIDIHYVEQVISDMRKTIDAEIIKRKNRLKKFRDDTEYPFTDDQLLYLDKLHKKLPYIVLAQPKELQQLKEDEFELPDGSLERHNVTRRGKEGKEKEVSVPSFKDKIISTLDYDELRQTLLPIFFQKIGIKACVYCNAQLTVSIDLEKDSSSGDKKVKAKFQVDHFTPKAQYPCFSISLFNLYPVCGPCNRAKSEDEIPFVLYSDEKAQLEESAFQFTLERGCIARYLLSRKIEDINLLFHERGKAKADKLMQNTFDIQGLYNTQKDLAEELILKKEIYTPAYKDALKSSFPQLFTDGSLSSRLIIGNYGSSKEIHKRPMAKFTQDIARQLGLIE